MEKEKNENIKMELLNGKLKYRAGIIYEDFVKRFKKIAKLDESDEVKKRLINKLFDEIKIVDKYTAWQEKNVRDTVFRWLVEEIFLDTDDQFGSIIPKEKYRPTWANTIRPKPGIDGWDTKWDAVCDEWDTKIEPKARDPEIRRDPEKNKQFIEEAKAIKQKMADLQEEKRLCQARDCIKYIPSWRSKNAKYCSERCRIREKNKRKYEKNPINQTIANLNYLKFLEKEGDLDPDLDPDNKET